MSIFNVFRCKLNMDPELYSRIAAHPHPLLIDLATADKGPPVVVAPIVISPKLPPDATTDLQEEIGRMAAEGVEERVR